MNFYAYVRRIILVPWTLQPMSAKSSEAERISQEEGREENRSLRPAFGGRRTKVILLTARVASQASCVQREGRDSSAAAAWPEGETSGRKKQPGR